MRIGEQALNRPDTYAVIAGGGTAGHVYPALAIAESLIETGRDANTLLFVGSKRGPEQELVSQAGFAIVTHDLRGIRRSVSPSALWSSLVAVGLLTAATWNCIRLFRRVRPRVVVSVGGYASMPAALSALFLRVPLVTCSYDLRPGFATRLQARWAKSTAVAYLPSRLPKAVLAGAPVRASIRRLGSSEPAADRATNLGFPQGLPVVAVVGGSLGSALLNEVAEVLRARLGDEVSILNLCGERFFDAGGENESHRADGSLRFRREARCSDMATVYASVDLIVMRAGASSIAEVAAAGVASVIVPWKDAAEDHQSANARLLGDRDAAVVIAEGPLVVDGVVDAVRSLIEDRGSLRDITQRAKVLGETHRHPRFAEIIEAVAR